MILILIHSTIITLFISCLTAVSPLNLGIIILFTAILIAIILSLIATSWFGFITFIIYVGGILVIFAYFAALQPNQQIIRWNWLLLPRIFFIVSTATFIRNKIIIKYSIMSSTTALFSSSNNYIPVLLAIILFLALIIVVKTSDANKGPLRPFNYV